MSPANANLSPKRKEDRWKLTESKSRPGKHYYFNESTGESRWSPPINAKVLNILSSEEHGKKSQDDSALRVEQEKPVDDLFHSGMCGQRNSSTIRIDPDIDSAEIVKIASDLVKKKYGIDKRRKVNFKAAASWKILKKTKSAKWRSVPRATGIDSNRITQSVAVCSPADESANQLNNVQGIKLNSLSNIATLESSDSKVALCEEHPSKESKERFSSEPLPVRFNTDEASKSINKNKFDDGKDNFKTPQGTTEYKLHKLTFKKEPAQERLKKLRSMLDSGKPIVHTKLTSPPGNQHSNGEPEAMDFEFMESEVLCDIQKLREGGLKNDNDHQLVCMDVDLDLPNSLPSTHSPLCVVLDTNILLAHLEFVESLRDIILPGRGMVYLYLPWQVLHELDHLKDNAKSSIKSLARRAINYLHQNFSSKHPRVRGQKLTESKRCSSDCPDDSILQSCLQLKEKNIDAILLSNDINLCNKAFVCGVMAYSKEELGNQIDVNRITDIASSPTESTPATINDIILCEMKAIIREELSEVVSRGMQQEYKLLWKKRCIIQPPWEVDEVLSCISSHWLPICGDFLPRSVKDIIQKLKIFFKKSNRYGIEVTDVKESLLLLSSLWKALPAKYKDLKDITSKKIETLDKKVNEEKCDKDAESSKSFSVIGDVGRNKNTFLLALEEAYSAASTLWKRYEGEKDVSYKDLVNEVQPMFDAVRQLLILLKAILLEPIDSLHEGIPLVVELVCLLTGIHSPSPRDVIQLCRQSSSRMLLRSAIEGFSYIEEQLRNKLPPGI